MFEISKSFEFCYGHRVWKQKLDSSCSLDSKCSCRALHGHNGTLTITLIGEELDTERDMVIDYKELNWFKKFVDDTLDHKMILDINDPSNKVSYPDLDWKNFSTFDKNKFSLWTVSTDHTKKNYFLESRREILEGLVFVDFCPTSENFARWIHGIVKEKLSHFINIKSLKVQFSETPKTTATYYE